MASTLEEVRDVLSDDTTVNIDRMRECASRGLPNEVRAEVWLYLLDVIPVSKASVHLKRKTLAAEYEAVDMEDTNGFSKRISFDVQRLRPQDQYFKDMAVRRRIKNVLIAYTNEHAVEYDSSFAQLISPLAVVIRTEADLYAAFSKTMQMIDELEPLNSRSSTCLTLFRSYLPELHEHFEDQEICFDTCLNPWLTGMLSAQVPMSAAIELWDIYLSKGFFIHSFVCISFLSTMKDELEELMEQQEIMSYLKHVPVVDVDQVLVHAENLYSTSKSIL